MRYLGGKHRQAAAVANTIVHLRDGRTRYIEPFMGGGSVFARVAPMFPVAVGGDASPSLVALWQDSVHGAWEPPTRMDRETWLEQKEGVDSALRAWAGYAASYNGKWFAGYGPKASGRDYLAESARGLRRKVSALTSHPNVSFIAGDYARHAVDSNTVVYCDPPYASTESYRAVDDFDHERFWQVMSKWSATGALVLVHEYVAPAGWSAVLEKDRVETMHHGGPSSGARREKLFALASGDGGRLRSQAETLEPQRLF